jgi:uncharacterized membrane protein YhaH (DUF805 family)
MSFGDAISTCFSQYVTFTGRARRSEYWYFFLFILLVEVAAVVIGAVIHFSLLGTVVSLAVLLPHLAVAVRRLHDTGRSGWWVLVGIIPLIGTVMLIVFFATDATPAGDKYGPAPKQLGYQAA